ncbi:sulfurtransferase [Tessaracoccus sp. MC1865]|uniref:sulfurtransferase n=1 Tax=Tessaracoccus sp. MC1865 TaxID=2760310 RepID=UPI0016005693|nr:sulfurtransferase [Tessaracoccus sp. MC1865]MBB1483509.1 sulfurtransferase [Tessaracoccus sp. MC1865]QTO36605.1 sulfurtransferase [Tessaracoccus sp. MC1865]
MIPPVVDVAWLQAHPHVVLADVRHYLDGRSGALAYEHGHLPGAVHVPMDEVLADPPTAELGRHPLPTPQRFADGLAAVGIGDDSIVVAYDDAGGSMAGRLVWLLRMLGRDAALLDGGMAAYDGELTTVVPDPAHATFTVRPWPDEALATIEEAARGSIVIDARGAERFRGETEPIDAKAGHIPGARSFPLTDNLTEDGHFLSPEELRERFRGIDDAAKTISYCGSGITACHNLIAMEYAGLGRGRLYPGSWSQYSGTERPVAVGE